MCISYENRTDLHFNPLSKHFFNLFFSNKYTSFNNVGVPPRSYIHRNLKK